MHEHNLTQTIINGVTGIMGAAVSYFSTIVQDVTAWMQVCSFFAGIAVSVLMCIKICGDIRNGRKK